MARLQAATEAPEPPPGTWGEPPRMPDVLALAASEGRHGAGLRSVVHALEAEPRNGLAAALARLGRAFMAKTADFTGLHGMRRNLTQR